MNEAAEVGEVAALQDRSVREQRAQQPEMLLEDIPKPLLYQTLETWNELPEELRNEVAARALVQTLLNRGPALYLLGFGPRTTHESIKLGRAVFDCPGVQTLLRRNMRDQLARKPDILARLTEIAISGGELAAVRAALVLSKVLRWEAPPAGPVTDARKIVNNFGHDSPEAKRALSAGGASGSATDYEELTHEPGEPIPISNPIDDMNDRRKH